MTEPNGAGDPAVLRDQIRRTRADLGETVQALTAKADVKARVKDSAAQTRDRVRQRAGRTAEVVRARARNTGEATRGDPAPWAAVAVGLVALVVVVVVVRGRQR